MTGNGFLDICSCIPIGFEEKEKTTADQAEPGSYREVFTRGSATQELRGSLAGPFFIHWPARG